MMVRKIEERKKSTAVNSALNRTEDQCAVEWKIQNKKILKKIAANCAVNSLANYSLAIQRARKEPLDELERRVMRDLRPKLSVALYEQTHLELTKLSPLDRYDFLANILERLRE